MAARSYFDSVWLLLEEEGYCDALGGAEYERVLVEWQAARLPEHALSDFIKRRANARGPS